MVGQYEAQKGCTGYGSCLNLIGGYLLYGGDRSLASHLRGSLIILLGTGW